MTDVYALPLHPAADLFPMLFGKDLEELASDIQANGLREPIVIYEQMGKQSILDGRSRLAACKRAGVKPKFVIFGGSDPIGYATSANLHRRHLNETQRSFLAIAIERLYGLEERRRLGRPKKTAANNPLTRGELSSRDRLATESKSPLMRGELSSGDREPLESKSPLTRGEPSSRDRHARESSARAGAQVGVSRSLVQRAKKVQAEAAPAVTTAARAGKITVNDALRALHYSEERQVEAIARIEAGEVRTLKEAFAEIDGFAFTNSGSATAGRMAERTHGEPSRPIVGMPAHRQANEKVTAAGSREPSCRQRHAGGTVSRDVVAASPPTRFMALPPAEDVKEDRPLLEEVWRRVFRLSRVAKEMLHRDLGRHLADLVAPSAASPSACRQAAGEPSSQALEETA